MTYEKRAILVHGYNVSDGGAGTTGGLRSELEEAGYEVLEFSTGWRGLFMVRFGNEKRAQELALIMREGDLLVGHSDGCNLINMATWFLEENYMVPPSVVVAYVNPALDRDAELAPRVRAAAVYHTNSDWVVKLARILPFHNWGDMGAHGYEGDDARYKNVCHGSLGVKGAGHSGLLHEPNKDALLEHLVRFDEKYSKIW